MKFYNTLKRKKEDFKEIKEGEVRIYTCGPTVYNYAHIGNWRSFVFSDLLRRYLKFKGYEVVHVMNLTDVDDKTIRDSQKEGITLKEFTERYTKYFFDDMDSLNIERVEYYPKATESIKEMIDITKKLLEDGVAYESEGSVYYDVSKFDEYGKLSKIDFEGLESTGRVKKDEYKDSAQDFALWKSYEDSDGDVFWDTDLGKGRPGWHIECSAMSMKFLGQHFDIHTGGIDLIFPHHENEIAQSEGYSGEKFVNYWLHGEHLLVEGEKMSKSKGNFYILKDIVEKGYDPLAIRYLLMSTHYRQTLNFTIEALDAAHNNVKKINEFILKLKAEKGEEDNPQVDGLVASAKEEFESAMDDDLNISKALAAVHKFMHEINKIDISRMDALKAFNLMKSFDQVLGILTEEDIPKEIMQLAEQRSDARKQKDWQKADELREKIKEMGYMVDDTPQGFVVKKL